MTTSSIRTIIAVSRLPRVGRVRLRTLLDDLKSLPKFDLGLADVVDRFKTQLPPVSPADLNRAKAEADEILARCESLGIAIRPYGSPLYPTQLTRLSEPPALLFSIGKFQLDCGPRIAVIGTRKPTDWGLRTAQDCAARIIEAGGVVVSGLALGIDTAAQSASVQHNGPTWAILAHGLHTISPSSNRDLAKRIVEQGGALVSEYPPGERAQRHYFVERDRIQAGLSDAVLVIETGIDGGSMHTVRFAQQAHISVWATFPDSKIRDAEVDQNALPESQKGTWELLRAKTATRVKTVKALSQMIQDLTTVPEMRPNTPLFQ
jgi:DNA processing protein